MTGAKKVTSVLLSAVMLMGNTISPLRAFSAETGNESNEVNTQAVVATEIEPYTEAATQTENSDIQSSKNESDQPVTESPDYLVTLPYYMEASFMVDENHLRSRKDQGDTVLSYKAGDGVKITISERDGFVLDEVKLVDAKNTAEPFSWETEDKISFLMPEKDLKLEASFVETEPETVALMEENIASEDQAQQASADDQTMETSAGQEATGSEEEAGSPEGQSVSADDTVTNSEISAEGSDPNAGSTDTAVAEGVVSSEQKELQIPAVDPEIEEDGFPVNGSIVRLAETSIPMEATQYEAETVFMDIAYPQETCRTELKSNSIAYGVPGLYDVIYRVDESTTGKFWYIVRPVRVAEMAVDPVRSQEGEDQSEGNEDAPEEDDETSHQKVMGEVVAPETVVTETMDGDPEGTIEEAVTEASSETELDADEEQEAVTEQADQGNEDIQNPADETEDALSPDTPKSGNGNEDSNVEGSSVHNILFDTGEGYTISMENDQVTYQEGDEVSFTVTADEKHVIKTAAAFVALTEETVEEGGQNAAASEPAPVLITDESVPVTRSASVNSTDGVVEATYEFEMPAEDVVLMASVVRGASASNDITVHLDNGGVKNIPKTWTPDGMEWANGRTTIGYTVYRTVTMPDGKERKAYCLQPAMGAEDDGNYTATEIRKKGKISAAEATLLRKGVFYCYGGPGWASDDIKNVLSDCSSNDEYYVATHYILSKIYCDATSGDWNIATSGGTNYVAMNARGKAQIEAAVAKLGTLPDPDAALSPTQAAGVYDETTGYAQTQAVTFSTNVANNNLKVTLPANVYLTVGSTTYTPGQKAVIPPNSTFVLKKNGYEAAHQETLNFKADIFTDFDAYLINVGDTKQNMGFSYVADKGFELLVNWPDLLTHLNIVKVDALTGNSTPTAGYTLDGAVYGIYADAGKTQLLEQLTISGGGATSSENYVIGRTYYIAEISTPPLYQIDTNVYPVVAVAGGTATVTSSDTPKTIRISVQKTDKETGQPYPQAKGLSFAGAVFGIYADAACTVKAKDMYGRDLPDIRTDDNGHAQSEQTLLIGNYYVKELAPPTGYLANADVFTVSSDTVREEIVNQDADAALTCAQQIIRANIDIMKVKTGKDLNNQAAEGVEFTFTYVNDESVSFTVVSGRQNTVITDAEGYATTTHRNYPLGTLIYGEWKITESNTPEGFRPIDPTTLTITGNGRTYRYVINNRQIYGALLIEKHDANTGSLIPAAGVQFKLFHNGEVVRLFNATTRAYEDTWTTDADGMVQLPEMLDYGTYTVKELPESLPDGYFIMEDAAFSVEEMADDPLHPITFTVMEPPQMGNIMVEKKDAKTEESLEGFSFEIMVAEDIMDPAGVIRTGTDADGNEVELTAGTVVDRITTGKNGNAVSKDLFLGSYTVRETKVQNGYAITTETKDVTLKGDSTKARRGENVSEYVLFENHPTTVRILKKSSKTDEPLEGITFLVHKLSEGETVADFEFTGEEETADGILICPERVFSDEKTQFDDGDDKDGEDDDEDDEDDETDGDEDEDQDDEEDDSDEDDDDEAEDDEDDPEDEDPDDESDDEVSDDWDEEIPEQSSGLNTELLDEHELYVTDENGEILVEYLDAGSTYVIREIGTIPGYNLSHELVSFTVDGDGLIDGDYIKEVTMKNEPNRLQISKQDITNGDEVPGARLTITDSEGNEVDEWTSTYEVHEITALPAGVYTLTEVTAPEGFEETESITFKVMNSRKIQAVAMKDSPFREVEVSKTDITGDKEIIGAHLTITDIDGNEVESWISTADVHTTKLHSGKYVLTETKPADGYVTAESIPFTVIRTSAKDYDIQGVAMKDDVTKVQITKSDITNGEPVVGAELVISDSEGNELYRWTTTPEPYYIEMLPIGTYTLTEITVPTGYATAETVGFTVEDTGEIQKVDMKDAPITLEISKKDIVDGPGGNELPGAHLTVKNENGEVVDDWISTSEPHKMVMLPVGKYTLTEVTAPNGYEVAESISFEISDTGEIHKVTMYDSPKEETVDLTGKKKTTTKGGGYTPGTTGTTSIVTAPVKTGDDAPILLWVVLAILSVGAGSLAFRLRRKGRIV